jgi:uncharacterized membrane protein
MIIVIYVLIFFILIFVAIIGFKAAGAGIEAKKRNKSNVQIRKKNISKDLSRLSKLYTSGAITKKEFQKAKNKVLKN